MKRTLSKGYYDKESRNRLRKMSGRKGSKRRRGGHCTCFWCLPMTIKRDEHCAQMKLEESLKDLRVPEGDDD